jgi:hypothetical protein
MIGGKGQARIMGKCLEKRGLRGKERYIETQNDTRKGAIKKNWKVFRETRVKERRRYIQTQYDTRNVASKNNGNF